MSFSRLAAALVLFAIAHSAPCQQPIVVVPEEAPTPLLLDQPQIVLLFGPIKEDGELAHHVAGSILSDCKAAGKAPIIVYIDSPGGDVVEGNLIISAMQLCTTHPIYTVDIANADSMAAIIFEHGTKRFMFPYAELMFHEPHLGVSGTPEQAESQLNVVKAEVEKIEKYLSKKFGLSLEAFRVKERAQWWLVGEEAIKAGAADAIGDPGL